jgi:two-component system response regulator HydG
LGRTTGPATLAAAPIVSSDGAKLKDVERELIVKALQDARNNRSEAARLLGITRSQLYTKIQRHRLEL